MTYLQLINDCKRECGLDGVVITSLTGLRDMDAKVAAWVRQSWRDIQNMQLWDFRRMDWTFTASTVSQTKPVDWAAPSLDFAWAGERRVGWLPWQDYRRAYSGSETGQIGAVVDGAGAVYFAPAPEAATAVRIEYFRTAQDLTAETDVPQGIASDLHDIVLWHAVMRYAASDEASATYQLAQSHFQNLLAVMTQRHAAEVGFAVEPLA